MTQLLRGLAATIEATYTNAEGVAVDPGVVTVTITRLNGTAVATAAATSGSGAAKRTYTLSGSVTADLDTLTVVWSSVTLGTITATYEIVGAFLFTVAEARAFDDKHLGTIDNEAEPTTYLYPTALIEAERERIAEEFERICEVSFIPRYRMVTLSADDDGTIRLPDMQVQAIRSVETRSGSAWTAFSADDLTDLVFDSAGLVARDTRGIFPTGNRLVRVGYEYGFPTVPLQIRRAALLTARYSLAVSWTSARTITASNEFGTQQYWTPGYSGRGSAIHELPEVDKILRQFMYRVPRVM